MRHPGAYKRRPISRVTVATVIESARGYRGSRAPLRQMVGGAPDRLDGFWQCSQPRRFLEFGDAGDIGAQHFKAEIVCVKSRGGAAGPGTDLLRQRLILVAQPTQGRPSSTCR
jgi:hypothetical protein